MRLHGRIGALGLLFMIIAFNGPLSGVIGYVPVVIGYGNGLGAPVAFLFGGIVLTAFAVGFVSMSKWVPNPGGFYSFITAGLGRTMGLGASMLALATYFVISLSSAAYFGIAMKQLVEVTFNGPVIDWWVYGIGILVAVGLLGYRHLEVSAKALFVLLGAEMLIVAIYDIAVLVQGGAEGLSADFVEPSHIFSGSVGLAIMFATITFAGFESTVVFRHEVRDPDRTIPRATFGFLAVVGICYAFSAWIVTQALGPSVAVEATAADPTGSVFATIEQFLGAFGVDAVNVLLNTSIIAAIISMHNVMSRYIFNLSTHGVFSKRLAVVHASHQSPYRASVVTTIACVVGLAALAISQADIVLLYAQLGGIFGYALLVLLVVTDVAVIVFFWRTKPMGVPVWKRIVAPVVALMGLVTVLVLGTLNIDFLLGVSAGQAYIICGAVYVLWALGSLWAQVLKRRRPGVYQSIGD
ncbi:APC family permease [Nocardioides sambongensis]|uniref:APC family permease n=1 Tax=Nocardioides sambongensis TaxID=2589074 RepID=UPI0015E83DA5|nr:APC family permease [Nocardioides sambongensis]